MLRRWRARLRIAALLGSAALTVTSCSKQRPETAAVRFTDLGQGVDYARFFATAVEREGAETRFSGHAFRIDLDKVGLRVLPAGGPSTRRRVSVITRSLPNVVAVNGSFFTPDGKAMGLVVDEGRLVARGRQKRWGAFVVKGSKARVMSGADVDLDEKPDLVLQGIPRLVEDGKAQKLKPQSAERTALCLPEGNGTSTLLVVSATRVDSTAFASFLARPISAGGLACREALNLDGGPSAQLVARLDGFSVDVQGGDGVPNALAALPGVLNRRATGGPASAPDDGAVLEDGGAPTDAGGPPDSGQASAH